MSLKQTDVALDVILVNFHSWRQVDHLLEVLRHEPGIKWRFLIVDNSPSDPVPPWVLSRESGDVVYLPSSHNIGFAAAVNCALRRSTADMVLLANPDIVEITGGCRNLVDRVASNPRLAAAAPLVLRQDGTVADGWAVIPSPSDIVRNYFGPPLASRHWVQRKRSRLLDPRQSLPRPIDNASGGFLLLNAAAVSDLGPLDERFFMYYEETEWLARAQDTGWSVDLVPQVRVLHGSGTAGSECGSPARALVLAESEMAFVSLRYGALRAGVVRFMCAVYVATLYVCDVFTRRRGETHGRELRARLFVLMGFARAPRESGGLEG